MLIGFLYLFRSPVADFIGLSFPPLSRISLRSTAILRHSLNSLNPRTLILSHNLFTRNFHLPYLIITMALAGKLRHAIFREDSKSNQ